MQHEQYMQRALQLAALGEGAVFPNPMVGSVIVNDEGKIVAEGYHRYFGGPHAEVDAIHQVPSDADCSQLSLYVTLEPCSHYGKTPPCADLVISKGFKQVFIGSLDPNPQVAGRGMKRIEDAGILSHPPICEAEAKRLNKRFFTNQVKKRAYLIAKWAQCSNGFIAHANGSSAQVSDLPNQTLVHTWRATEQAIMVGYNTALWDNPSLTTRLVEGKNPIRLVLDQHGNLPSHLRVFDGVVRTIVLTENTAASYPNAELVVISDWTPLSILQAVWQKGIGSILLEGGAKTHEWFMQANVVDEFRVTVNPAISLADGIAAPRVSMPPVQPVTVGQTLLYQWHTFTEL